MSNEVLLRKFKKWSCDNEERNGRIGISTVMIGVSVQFFFSPPLPEVVVLGWCSTGAVLCLISVIGKVLKNEV